MTPPRLILGLLGPVAAGKSFVAARLAALGGGRVLDADALAHGELERAAQDGRLVAALGPASLKDGRADRDALRARAQSDPAVRRTLEDLTHPAVRAEIEAAVAAHRRGEGPALLVLDVPLLLESGLDRLCDTLWYVDVPEALRRQRALARGVPPAELERWASAQLPQDAKRARAQVVVRNDVSPAELDRRLAAAWAAQAAS